MFDLKEFLFNMAESFVKDKIVQGIEIGGDILLAKLVSSIYNSAADSPIKDFYASKEDLIYVLETKYDLVFSLFPFNTLKDVFDNDYSNKFEAIFKSKEHNHYIRVVASGIYSKLNNTSTANVIEIYTLTTWKDKVIDEFYNGLLETIEPGIQFRKDEGGGAYYSLENYKELFYQDLFIDETDYLDKIITTYKAKGKCNILLHGPVGNQKTTFIKRLVYDLAKYLNYEDETTVYLYNSIPSTFEGTINIIEDLDSLVSSYSDTSQNGQVTFAVLSELLDTEKEKNNKKKSKNSISSYKPNATLSNFINLLDGTEDFFFSKNKENKLGKFLIVTANNLGALPVQLINRRFDYQLCFPNPSKEKWSKILSFKLSEQEATKVSNILASFINELSVSSLIKLSTSLSYYVDINVEITEEIIKKEYTNLHIKF